MRTSDRAGRPGRPVVPHTLIRRDEELAPLVDHLRRERCARLAIDVESEHNLHRYGIHVCLIQLCDGKRAWIVDVLALRNPASLGPLLEKAPWTLVWFDAVSDLLSIRHDLGLRPSPILDLALAARLLGKEGGLSTLTTRTESASAKGRLQMANWMRRPLSSAMLNYAIADVTGLLPLADALLAELEEKNLTADFRARNLAIQEAERSWDPFANFTRIPGYKRLSPGGRRLARLLWYARELYAEERDIPSGNAASKEDLRQLVDRGLCTGESVAGFLNRNRKRNHLDPSLFGACLRAAGERLAAEESSAGDGGGKKDLQPGGQ